MRTCGALNKAKMSLEAKRVEFAAAEQKVDDLLRQAALAYGRKMKKILAAGAKGGKSAQTDVKAGAKVETFVQTDVNVGAKGRKSVQTDESDGDDDDDETARVEQVLALDDLEGCAP